MILDFWLWKWNSRHCLGNKHVPVVSFLKFLLHLHGPWGMFSKELFNVVAMIWGSTCQKCIPLAHSPRNGVYLVAARCARWSCDNECCYGRSLFNYSWKIIHRHGNLVIFPLEELKFRVLFLNAWVWKPQYEVKQSFCFCLQLFGVWLFQFRYVQSIWKICFSVLLSWSSLVFKLNVLALEWIWIMQVLSVTKYFCFSVLKTKGVKP